MKLKTMLQIIFGSINRFFKITTSYNYCIWIDVNHSIIFMLIIPSFLCRFENLSKLYTSNKRIWSRKSFTAIALVLYMVSMIKYQNWSLKILLNWCRLQLLKCLLAIQSILFEFKNPSKHVLFYNRLVCSKNFKSIVSLV